MLKKLAAIAALVMAMAIHTPAMAQLTGSNFAGRKPVIINNAADYLTLSDFTFENTYRDRSTRFIRDLKWANTGSKPIIAFEVVMLFYDPFNRPIAGAGGRWLVPGHNSANWSALAPGQTDGDGLIGLRDQNAFFGIAYVRAIRFDDGTVWTSNQAEVERSIRAELPQLREIGELEPTPQPAADR
ncbi:MAG: hypothetical protein KJ690_16445 [Alphaproteobacteria bacterium]|nr:hypothetical protein [Alphaproteobacteria bacterium]